MVFTSAETKLSTFPRNLKNLEINLNRLALRRNWYTIGLFAFSCYKKLFLGNEQICKVLRCNATISSFCFRDFSSSCFTVCLIERYVKCSFSSVFSCIYSMRPKHLCNGLECRLHCITEPGTVDSLRQAKGQFVISGLKSSLCSLSFAGSQRV